MSLLPAIPERAELVTPDVAQRLEHQIASTVMLVEDIETADEWRAQAEAMATYLRDKDSKGPMTGAVRRIEARIGELLGEAAGRGHSEMTPHAESFHPERRREFRTLAKAVQRGVLVYAQDGDDSPWRASRRALLLTLGVGVHGSSERHDWETPQDLFDDLDAEFTFDLDVCATAKTAKCERYFTPADDGLAQEWRQVCWMNPPYGGAIGSWVAKAAAEARAGAKAVVCLVPARVDTGWWWDYCRHGEIRFLKGRLHFDEGDTGAPFPSAVVVFGLPARVVWWER